MNGRSIRRPSAPVGKRRSRRRGAAIVELAIVLPVLLMGIIGMITFSWLFLAKHTMLHAAREGARALAVQGATVEQAQARTTEVLGSLGFGQYEFTTTAEKTGTEARVSVSIPSSSLSIAGDIYGWLGEGTMSTSAVMKDEGA